MYTSRHKCVHPSIHKKATAGDTGVCVCVHSLLCARRENDRSVGWSAVRPSLFSSLCWNLSFSSISIAISKSQAAGNACTDVPQCVYTTNKGACVCVPVDARTAKGEKARIVSVSLCRARAGHQAVGSRPFVASWLTRPLTIGRGSIRHSLCRTVS